MVITGRDSAPLRKRLQALGMEPIVLGPGSIDQAHQPDEFLRLDRLQPTIEVLRQLIAACCTGRTDLAA